MSDQVASPDVRLAKTAARQHGVVSSRQLAEAGIDKQAVTRRTRAGKLHRVHRGVYAVGHRALSREGRWMAAVLACGAEAVLSHLSAAALWDLLTPGTGSVQVTVAGLGGRPRRPGIRLHRSRTLMPEHTTRHRGIPVTTPGRTIADLRRSIAAPQLRRAIRQASVLGLDVGTDVEAEPTRSELEHRFLRLCRRHRLPPPAVNAEVGGFTVDFLWQDRLLIVETDGYRYHRGRVAFEEDRVRDVELRLFGYEVVRFTYRQVTEDPAGVAATLRALHSRGEARSLPQ
jgi:very-short-patch-repair endonuclease